MARELLSIDFDGVIKDMGSDNPLPNAGPAISRLAKRYDLVVFTARPDTGFVKQWIFNKLGLHMRVTNQKEPSIAYIDDKAFKFSPGRGGWMDVLNNF